MVDEDSHSTDLTVKKVIQQFCWLITLFGFNWGQTYLTTLVTLQNCTNMLRYHSLTFLVQFAYFSIRPKKFLFFQATFEQLSSQKATFDCFLSNFWQILGNFIENLEQLVESPKHDSEAFWSFFYIWVGFLCAQDNAGSCEKSAILSPKPRSHDRIFIYRTWAIIMDGPWKAEGLCQLRFNFFWLQSFSHERQ